MVIHSTKVCLYRNGSYAPNFFEIRLVNQQGPYLDQYFIWMLVNILGHRKMQVNWG